MQDEMTTMGSWMPIVAALIGAFAAGTVAFLVSQINAKIERNRRTWRFHRKALISLQFRLNEIIAIVVDNRFITQRIRAINYDYNDTTPLTWMEPHPLPNISDLYPQLLRIDIVNSSFSLQNLIRKHNDDVVQVCRAYADMRRAKLEGAIHVVQYYGSLEEFQRNSELLSRAYELLDTRTVDLLAHVRVSNDQDMELDYEKFLSVPKCQPYSSLEVEKMESQIREEMELIAAKSRKELKAAFGS